MTQQQTQTNIQTVVAEIRRMMSAHIPDFEQKFAVDFTEAAINEVRLAKSFEIQTARALVFGETGVGKTTTINYILNSPVFPTSGELSCTKSLACGEHEGGLIFYDSPGLGDEEGLENVTRVTLGIEQLEDDPIDHISLIDITANNAEGPTAHEVLPYEAFADEISADFYEQHQASIVAKRFEADSFASWAIEHFDFFVFVASSNRGLPTPVAKTLQAFDQRQQTAKLFKVFNVFGQKYRKTAEALEPAIRKKYEQAKERSLKFGLSEAEQWYLIDSQTGDGVGDLIQAFADTLPVDLLRTLNQVVQERYVHLIEQRIVAYFFDYTTHVAALLAVFPVDYSTQGQSFLRFAMQSLLTMAQFMFASKTMISEGQALRKPSENRRLSLSKPTSTSSVYVSSKDIIEGVIGELEFSKRRMTYTDTVAKRKKKNFLLNIVDKMGKNINANFDAYDEFNAYDLEPQRVAQDEYFTIGGIDAIHLTLGFGLALQMLHAESAGDISQQAWETALEAARRTVEYNTTARLRAQLVQTIRIARESDDKAETLRLANDLYPHIRPLLEQAGVSR